MVANTGDRPVQVGSHYHFAEANPALDFDRAAARGTARHSGGHRRALRAGPAARGALIPIGGARRIFGFNQQSWETLMPATIKRADYAAMFGPTTGDRVRLADTDLIIEVERDLTGPYGEEVKFGGGKVIRDGMGQSQATRAEGAVDTVITNALIVDWTGIYKADVGLRDGRIAARSARPATPTRSPA